MMHLVNLTPHDVIVFSPVGEEVLTVPASGALARISEVLEPARPLTVDGVEVPTCRMTYADTVNGLPARTPGTAYIVSRVLARAVPRADVYFPAEEVRDDAGRIIGCRSLGQFTDTSEGDT